MDIAAHPPRTSTAAVLSAAAEPLPSLDDPAFGAVFDRFGQSRIVLLGEASHGTSEFYRARAAITRRLIEQYGFTIVAVEADWPDAAALSHMALSYASPTEPIDGRTPASLQRLPNASDVYWVDSIGCRNTGMEGGAMAGRRRSDRALREKLRSPGRPPGNHPASTAYRD
jgi:hypothetical protein